MRELCIACILRRPRGAAEAAVRSAPPTGGSGRVPEAYTRGRPRSSPNRPGSGGVGPLPAEVVLESDHVIELGSRHLDELAPFDRLEPMDASCRDPCGLPRTQFVLAHDTLVVLEIQTQAAGSDQYALV